MYLFRLSVTKKCSHGSLHMVFQQMLCLVANRFKVLPLKLALITLTAEVTHFSARNTLPSYLGYCIDERKKEIYPFHSLSRVRQFVIWNFRIYFQTPVPLSLPVCAVIVNTVY